MHTSYGCGIGISRAGFTRERTTYTDKALATMRYDHIKKNKKLKN